jgi:outer membrane receptor protein involved in Fe transport
MNRVNRAAIPMFVAAALASAAAMAEPQSTQSSSQTGSNQSAQQKDEGLAEVVVTGSRIKRVLSEGATPVTILTNEEITKEGFQTVADALQTLNQNTTSSFTGDLAVTGFSPNAQVVNLRNLGPGYTLTLINGRRPAQYPQPYNRDNNVVNVRAIPQAAIERIEVLTGGASAIYGADAVAGVVNIITRKDFDGDSINVNGGTTYEGGGDNYNISYTGGRTGDNWSGVVALQYGQNDPIFASERKKFADLRNGPLGTFVNPALSLVALDSASGRPTTNQNLLYPGQALCDQYGYSNPTPGVPTVRGNYCGSFNQVASRSIQNAYKFYSVYASGNYDISENLSLFASATYYKSDAKASSGTEFWGTSGSQFNLTSSGGRTAFYFDPTFGTFVQLQRVFNPFELGGSEAVATLFDEKTWDATIGARGTIFDDYDWEVSYMKSEYNYVQDRPRLLAKAMQDLFLGPRLGFVSGQPAYNLNRTAWLTPFTPEQYRSVSTRIQNVADTGSETLNATLSGTVMDLPAGPLGFAAVAEWGSQDVDLRSDPRLNPLRPIDDQTVYNLVSSGRTIGTRDRMAAGLEVRVPILSSLTANLAGRWDKYDDISEVDDAFTYQLGLEWRPLDSLLLRGSLSTSFRAPDMQLVYAEGAASFSTILDAYSCRSGTGPAAGRGPRTTAQCNVSGDPTIYTAQSLIAGNPRLKEEEGESMTAGFVWDVNDRFSVSADYYRIKLNDAASQLSSTFLLTNEANCRLGTNPDGTPFNQAADSAFCQNVVGLITRQSAPGTTLDGAVQRINTAYINTANIETSGVDSTVRFSVPTDSLGTFGVNVAYTIVLSDKYRQFLTDPLIDYRDNIANFNSRSRVRATLSWTRKDWNATLLGTRYGSIGNSVNAAGTNAVGTAYGARLAPFMLYNLSVGKSFGDHVRAQLAVVNVFNNTDREDPSATGYPFFEYYLGADPTGRRFNLSVTYKF